MVGVIYNQAAAIANRTLQKTSDAATNSLEKLSSGKRVVNAKDDVSSMAIGSRMQLVSKALKVLTNNVTQGLSITSIAEGGISRVQEMLGRMQELAAQAGSDNLGATERGFLNSEFQAMKAEITRTTASTRFNGSALINGNQVYSDAGSYAAAQNAQQLGTGTQGNTFTNHFTNGVGGLALRGAAFGIQDIAFGNLGGLPNGQSGHLQYNGNANGGNFSFYLGGTNAAFLSGAIDTSILNGGGNLATGASVRLSSSASGVNALNGADAYVVLNLNTNFALTNTNFNSNLPVGNLTHTFTTAAGGANIQTGLAGYAALAGGNISENIAGAILFNTNQTNQTNLAFKIGDGGQAYNAINSYIQGVNLAALGLTNADITTKQGSDGASDAIKNALESVVTSRTSVGAVQSRLQTAGENQKVMLENIDASVSAYLDVDISTEMTKLTSLQVLQQIGVAMSSQANNNAKDFTRLLQ
jgi:flagellin